ncbi:leucyl/phenylalanyl-tRNA--protein transferase [Dermatobacter hominis]|uniref:leucyl/phenylalanyl-tRNA--protein transferase n=1 Tax=Dermatobacter hominis TaxID=2884263 RepID=UPI001D113757|nr:leucyl/phenylalanyl-tRNA--protein transferase [Dermatobacter hominis]UDY38075.1 leucyl/phenylalanyl-tRNA--protein transferase [Dermatobacter hominis]
MRRIPRVDPPPSRWVFPPVDDADVDGPVVLGGDLEPGTLLGAYRAGLFPMPIGRRRLGWWSPDPRGIIPVGPAAAADGGGFHVSRSLRRSLPRFTATVDRDFEGVMRACGDPRRPHGWINEEFVRAYSRLHSLGWAHSVEVWEDGELVGGVYGVSIGAFFAGESMFHRATDASKAALVHLTALFDQVDGALFDVQWLTPHLASLGAVEVDRAEYLARLGVAVASPADPFA